MPERLALTAGDPLALAARKILARQAFLVSRHVAGTIEGTDPEELHDLRVASRRARAALRLLREALPADRAAVWREELRWLGGLSGAARDADVFGQRVGLHLRELGVPAAARRPLLSLLAEDRRDARGRLAEALRSDRFTRLVAELGSLPEGFGADGAGHAGDGSACDLAPALIRRELRRLRRWRRRRIELLTAAELHAIRIAGKRARYALEFFADILDPGLWDHIRTFVALQDCLGAHQDAVVARARLAGAAGRLAAAGTGPETLAAVDALMRRERELAAGRRRELAELGPELFRLVKRILFELGG
ncbi:MAG: CHAD domain-containing protein [Thermoanaerobaculaceae bacterium]